MRKSLKTIILIDLIIHQAYDIISCCGHIQLNCQHSTDIPNSIYERILQAKLSSAAKFENQCNYMTQFAKATVHSNRRYLANMKNMLRNSCAIAEVLLS